MTLNFFKPLILKLLPDSDRLRYAAYKPMFQTWCKTRAGTCPIFQERTQMYDYLASEVLGDQPIHYLEFGVFHGASIRYFSEINKNPDSRFVGFDTFEGLPEDWSEFSGTTKKNTFDTNGNIPEINDNRVTFKKGLFQETLPGYLQDVKFSYPLLINNDSDLYSATLYVLTSANDIILPGTVIIFDEFYSATHEFRALMDYSASYLRKYEVVAATQDHIQVAIKIL